MVAVKKADHIYTDEQLVDAYKTEECFKIPFYILIKVGYIINVCNAVENKSTNYVIQSS